MIEFVLIAALAQTETVIDEAPPKDYGHLQLDLGFGANWYEDFLNQDMGSGGFGTIGVAYEWGLGDTTYVAVELEYSQHNGNTSDSFSLFPKRGKGGEADVGYYGDLTSHAFMINGMIDQSFGKGHDGWGLFFGGGIGASYNRGNLAYSITRMHHHSEKSRKVYDSSTDFAWQIFGGVRYQFNDHWRLYVELRYADLGSIAAPVDLKVESLALMFGVRWNH